MIEIEFACARNEWLHAPLYRRLAAIPGLLPYRQRFDESDHPYTLAVIIVDDTRREALRMRVHALAAEWCVAVDVEQSVTPRFIESVRRGTLEHLLEAP